MSKNSPKQNYTQLMEWLKSRETKSSNTKSKKTRFENYKQKGVR